MDLETVIQNEVSQKEKTRCHIILHICGIQKNGTDELICKAEIERDVENELTDTQAERVGGMNQELGKDIYTIMYKIDS